MRSSVLGRTALKAVGWKSRNQGMTSAPRFRQMGPQSLAGPKLGGTTLVLLGTQAGGR